MANSRRRGNCIDRLKVGEEITEDKGLIKEEILSYYQNLYNEKEAWRPSLEFTRLHTLSSNDREDVKSPFEEPDVLAALNSYAPDKVSGPDCYTMAFFQKCWEVLKSNFMGALNHYYQHGHMVKSCNASFIALIPKEKCSIELKDFRLISLIGSVYKLVAKILAERMKRVIRKLDSSQQSAFVKNKKLHMHP
uniref:Reverse transcriptase domain-containing protein n=2 Tax=Nicotiana TaxID=4085 RepID=A0A1S4BVC1_TOBAC|nr:PREDICTED: uncharacterized protein LOC104221690 [Nicotiana sylvestris]XP_016492827.1 PREDICTED: uncharacterized protein LOC107812285 [Nicotiana tabacum]